MTDDRPLRGPRSSNLSDAPTGQMRPPAGLTLDVAGRTDKGRVRPGNEDAYAVESPTSARARAQGTLLLVADGMGGHAAGEVASQLAVDTVRAAYYRARNVPVADAILDAISQANSAIYESAERDPARTGMGCTIVALVVQGGGLTIGHVGDSRAYLIRNGQARQLTRDHSWVAMQVAEGILTPEQAEHHPNRSVLVRALGRQATVDVDIGHERLQPGDVLVICSDGLTGVVHDEEIAAYVGQHGPATLAEQLIGLANRRGAPDNVTVVAAAIGGSAGAIDDTADAATTSILPRLLDPPTPRMVEPLTDGALPRPGEHSDDAPTIRQPPRAAPADAPSGAPAGTPVVLSRSSTPASGPHLGGGGRSGRRRLLIASLAMLGLAAGLVLLTMLIRVEGTSQADTSRGADTPNAAPTAAPAATRPPIATAIPTITVPPPVATGLPAVTAPTPPLAPTPTAVPTQPPAPTVAPTSASQPNLTATSVAGAASAAGRGLATLVPAVAASPPAILIPTSAPTATPTPDQGAVEPGPPADAGAADAPASSSDAPPDASAPEMAPPDAAADAPPPDAPPSDQPPPPAAAPPAQGTRAGPGGFSIPGIPGFRPGRKRND